MALTDFQSGQTLVAVGIGGSGMRGLAYLLARRGVSIIGTDRDVERLRSELDMAGYRLVDEAAAAAALSQADCLLYSDAVAADHPLRVAAAERGVAEASYPQALGIFARPFQTIAVAGTHGKSSTTAFLGHILIEAGLDPTVLVGARVPTWEGGNARLGASEWFVVEADEYRNHFLTLAPAHVIVTTIDFDHPDFFGSLADVEHTFAQLLSRVAPGGSVVTLADVRRKHAQLPWPASTILVDGEAADLPEPLPGAHMQRNAALAMRMAEGLGVSASAARAALKHFPGLGRRFERLGAVGAMTVISDYGHHPEEIRATLAGARRRYPGKKILALFEPHTESRLARFGEAFAQALAAADGVVLCPLFAVAGRDQEPTHASRDLAPRLAALAIPTWVLPAYRALPEQLRDRATQFDVAIAFSAGALDGELRGWLQPA